MYDKELKILKELYHAGLFSKPFYAERLNGESDFDSYDNFIRIPFMYKEDIRRTKPMERSSVPAEDVYGFFSSSGTTGDKTFYAFSNRDKEVHEEVVHAFYTELGVTPADIGGVFAPVDTGVMAHTMMWQFTTMGASYVNCPEPSPQNMIQTVTELPVTVIATRPSVVCSVFGNPGFEQAARESCVNKMLLGGGFLTNGRRNAIEKVWDAKCYCMFGMSEIFGPMGGECRNQNGIHYPDNYILVEVLDPVTFEPVKPGEYGVAVYTTLWDKGFPILRYWTDDYIAIDNSPCSCGSTMPRFYYKGRMADSIEINGEYVFPPQLENILFTHGYTGEYRVVKGDDIKVILDSSMRELITDEVKAEIRDMFFGDVVYDFAESAELMYDGHSVRFSTEK